MTTIQKFRNAYQNENASDVQTYFERLKADAKRTAENLEEATDEYRAGNLTRGTLDNCANIASVAAANLFEADQAMAYQTGTTGN